MEKTLEEKMKRIMGHDNAIEKNEQKTEDNKIVETKPKEDDSTDTPSVQKRINKLVAEKKAAKEEHEKLRAEFDEFKKKAPKASDPVSFKGEPQLKDFDHVGKWAEAMKQFHTQEVSKHLEKKLRDENKVKEESSKFAKMVDHGKKYTDIHGLEPEEYEDRINSMNGKMKMHKGVAKEILDSDHGHMILLDIADDLEGFNKMSEGDEDGSGSKQMKWFAKREQYHEDKASESKVKVEDKPMRKSTKASSPDRDLETGLGSMEDKSFTKKDGTVNMKNIRDAMKKGRR